MHPALLCLSIEPDTPIKALCVVWKAPVMFYMPCYGEPPNWNTLDILNAVHTVKH